MDKLWAGEIYIMEDCMFRSKIMSLFAKVASDLCDQLTNIISSLSVLSSNSHPDFNQPRSQPRKCH